MASVHKQKRKPHYFAAFSTWNPTTLRWERHFKSTKSANKKQAEEIARLSPEDREYLPTLAVQHYKSGGGYVEGTIRFSLAERALVKLRRIAMLEETWQGSSVGRARDS